MINLLKPCPMKTKILLSILTLGLFISVFGQNTIELTFTAIDSAAYVQLDSINVINRTQGGDTVLHYPDTVLVLDYQVGILETDFGTEGFQVYQNYPNPVTGHTTISLCVPQKDVVSLRLTDLLGRVSLKSDRELDKGMHSFRLVPGDGKLFFFTAQWRNQSSSIKILQADPSQGNVSLQYLYSEDTPPGYKSTSAIQGFNFTPGDELLYIGYTDTLQSGMLYAPEESTTYTFQFAINISCPGTPTVEYEGQVYNTIQIFSQCWLKENLNVGKMINGIDWQFNNGIIEKYCYNNDTNNCNTYGGLYQWWEMLQYTTQQGVQGICPPGWHLPTNEEWKVLEGSVDSQYGIGDPQWDTVISYRGYDAGMNLKTKSGWYENGNGTDLFGFSGLPGGWRIDAGGFHEVGVYGKWWTSTEYNYNNESARYRSLRNNRSGIYQLLMPKGMGLSVRCLRD